VNVHSDKITNFRTHALVISKEQTKIHQHNNVDIL